MDKRALTIALTAVALYWAADYVLTTPVNRNVVDVASILIALVLGTRVLPDAWDAVRARPIKGVGALIIGYVLFWYGWAAFCSWSFIYREWERPDWMAESPMNGFFKFWILSAGVLSYFATSRIPTPLPPHRLYYIVTGVVAGILIGLAAARLFGV